jgi:hypothetical protein
MERWRDGEMERWRDGEMERWRDGEIERWRERENVKSWPQCLMRRRRCQVKWAANSSIIFFECRQIFIQSHKEAQTRSAAVAQNICLVIPRLRVSVQLLLLAPGDFKK